jgi:hypothetical protein
MGIAAGCNISGSGLPFMRGPTALGEYTVTHSGVIGSLSTTDAVQAGDLLFTVDIHPEMEEWLSTQSHFDKYRVKHAVIGFRPSCPTTTEGAIVGFYEWDVDNALTTGQGVETIKRAMSHNQAHMSAVWEATNYVYSGLNDKEMFYVDKTGAEPRLTTQGRFSILAATDIAADTELGQLEIAYEVVFLNPALRNRVNGAYCCYSGSTTGVDDDAILGEELTVSKIYYEDHLGSYEESPQNLQLRYYYDGTSSAIQLPRGYYVVFLAVTGAGISELEMEVGGEYQILTDQTYALKDEMTNAGETGALAFAAFYSSGMTLGVSTGAIPADYVRPTTSRVSSTSRSMLYIVALNGAPMASVPASAMFSALKESRRRLENVEGILARMGFKGATMPPPGDGASSSSSNADAVRAAKDYVGKVRR